MSTRDLAAADIRSIIEDDGGEGIPITLISNDKEYPLRGTLGDIGSLINPISGEPIQGRAIEATIVAQSIVIVAGKVPVRGWKARAIGLDGKELTLFVQRNEYDRTVGLCRLTLGLTLQESENEL